MKKEQSMIRRYMPVIVMAGVFALFVVMVPQRADKAWSSLWHQLASMAFVLPPIFLILGLLDIWVPRETFIRLLGESSGVTGKLIAFALGSAAAGPLYGAFPVAAMMMKKGAGFSNILVFIGAWSTTKIPMLLFEMQSVGIRFALARLAINIPGIIIIALAVRRFVPAREVERIYAVAKEE